MKKIISLLLAIVLCLSVCACGSTPAQETTEPVEVIPQIWSAKKTVDEFGDITEDSVTVLEASIAGDFSNSATTSSELTGSVSFIQKPGTEHYSAVFGLLEYGNNPISNVTNNAVNMKVKVGDTITELPLTWEDSSRELLLSSSEYDYAADSVFNVLYSGQDLRCIIYIGNSQYNFDIISANFAKVCEAENFPMALGKMTLQEAVNIYVTDDGDHMRAAFDFFTNERNNFEVVGSAELIEALSGNFFEIEIDTFATNWGIYNYDNQAKTTIGQLNYREIVRFYEKAAFIVGITSNEYTIENDLLKETFDGKELAPKQVFKLSDDIYVSYRSNKDGEFVVPDHLMIRYNEEVSNGSDVYDKMIPYIQSNLIPLL